MTENRIWTRASAADVWRVLADPHLYSEWVFGTADSSGLEGEWPEEGAALRWEAGVGPLRTGGETRVRVSEPERRLELRAELGPLGAIDIEIALAPDGDGTTVTLAERAAAGAARVVEPVTDAVNAIRTAFSLERLRELAER